MTTDALGTLADRNGVDYEPAVPDFLGEARRQLEICNACRYCEGYCAVFPAMTLNRAFSDGEVTQLANLCHNCRGCFHACQYTAPHEFDLNLPKALAEVRVDSWEKYMWPAPIGRLFQRSGIALAAALVAALALLLMIAYAVRPADGQGFYAVISHTVMASLFSAATFFPAAIVAAGIWRYWRDVGGKRVTLTHLREALVDAGRLKNLSGGAAEGCNYEQEDRFSMARRWAHQAMMWGVLLCFASTVSGSIAHYGFGVEAPYGLFSVPKLLGIPGGILMTIGGGWLVALKLRAEKSLGAPTVWGGEMAFVLLLLLVGISGLVLFGASGTDAMRPLLIIHLGAVLALYLTLPYTKMVHVPFRLAALVRDAQTRARPLPEAAARNP